MITLDLLFTFIFFGANFYYVTNFKDKPTIIPAVGLKRQYPNTFSDVSEEKFKEIYEAEGKEEREECNDFLEARNSASKEINEKRSYKIGDYNYYLAEEELGFEYLELFFNDNCNCDRPNYYEHLIKDCLKTKEQITEFKNKVLKIMDRKIQENKEKEKKDNNNSSNNNDYPPNFNNNHDPSLGNFKNTACQKIIKKRSEIALSHNIYLSENDLLAEANYKNCFGHSCSYFNTSSPIIEHIWDCLNNVEEIRAFKDQIISVLEQIYREKSSSPNVKKFSEEEIREKLAEEEEKWEEKNQKNKDNSPLPPDKNQERDIPKEKNKPNSDKNKENKKTELIIKIKKLKQEIEKLKAIKNKTPAQQAELSEKEKKLRELEKELGKYNTNQANSPNSDNKFPVGWVIGGGMLVLVGGLMVVLIAKKNKKNRRR